MVKVKLFANFREIVGSKEIEINAKSVKELLNSLIKDYPKLKEHFSENRLKEYVHIMVNGKIVEDLDERLNKNDVVAIFPPVSGGFN
ncbi:molybdopterin synthase sulfur carrier subunit [Archaeoglobales archaeon]|nr:MAG: molybdopterin synthase sulfur carrier subunit [Archaeoglobales archaeon]